MLGCIFWHAADFRHPVLKDFGIKWHLVRIAVLLFPGHIRLMRNANNYWHAHIRDFSEEACKIAFNSEFKTVTFFILMVFWFFIRNVTGVYIVKFFS